MRGELGVNRESNGQSEESGRTPDREIARYQIVRSEAHEVECRLPVEFDLAAFVARVEKVLAARVRRRPIQFSVEADPALPRMLQGNPSQLGQLLVVLAGDVIRQTERGAVSIHLRLASDMLPVHDAEEIPIEAEVRSPGSVALSRDWESIQPGGMLEREEDEDGTSTLRVRMRFRRGTRSAAPARFAGIAVLVVDDSAVNRRLCQVHLEKLGCQVILAEGGREALSLINAAQPDVILMDCLMPGMDGLEATRAIRARGDAIAQTPIIALTGVDTEEERQACFDAGMDDFLSKPFQAHELLAVLGRQLERKAA